jgi:hypothetical protein
MNPFRLRQSLDLFLPVGDMALPALARGPWKNTVRS